MRSTIDRVYIIIAAVLVVAALVSLVHLAMLGADPAVSADPVQAQVRTSALPYQWDWTVDGQALALDPETGEPAVPDWWTGNGCGCVDPALIEGE